jgi:hypothetical protein
MLISAGGISARLYYLGLDIRGGGTEQIKIAVTGNMEGEYEYLCSCITATLRVNLSLCKACKQTVAAQV